MSGILSNIQSVFGNLQSKFQNVFDRIFPPEQRAEVLAKLQNFAINNPKLAAFLTAQIALTGFPLVLFITFGITVFLFALIAALLVGLVAALLFTVAMVAVALVVVLPTIFLTTFTATFVFLWGLGGYYILKWVNDGGASAPDGKAIGDKLNSLTGGRMGWLVDGSRKKVDDSRKGIDQTPKKQSNETNGSSKGGNAKSESKEDNASAKSTGASDAGNHVSEAKETVTKRPPKLNVADKSGANSGKDESSDTAE